MNNVGALALLLPVALRMAREHGHAPSLLLMPLAFGSLLGGLLTLIVSLESIFLAIFVLVSQNRQSERDRIRTDLDYQVNVKAHVEIVEVNRRLEQVEQILSRIDRQTAPSG